ncbi:MAG: ethanolamine ammonia-lyase subunit EutC [Rubrivivax sp.]|nr:ethanolamine ammonia-lyase subunit EutC [Rubrivivax sp.]
MSAPDPWSDLRRHTAARIALGRAGVSLPTAEWLRFALAHAQARDAVHLSFDDETLASALGSHGFTTLRLESTAVDRASYLRRPDLGRRLSARSAALLQALPEAAHDLAVVVGDGLSARAVHEQALPLLLELRPRLEADAVALGAVALVRQCRVALGDEVGALLGARAVLVLIGERPGLSSPDSLGAYLTWAPRVGRSDAERNCVSNIRPAGQPPAEAARRIAWLLAGARRLGASGIALKDDSDASDAKGERPHLGG